ncbi:hypothetical protein BDZ91DRAFT_731684 [Kalaharituber pfeilii]|nr:hypothetical protein BDZ91DRAFT_731684 [Kalaharituber pfeilii]
MLLQVRLAKSPHFIINLFVYFTSILVLGRNTTKLSEVNTPHFMIALFGPATLHTTSTRQFKKRIQR